MTTTTIDQPTKFEVDTQCSLLEMPNYFVQVENTPDPKPDTPPGSEAALALGCSCPVMDNAYGEGRNIGGEVVYWTVADCRVHAYDYGAFS